MTYVFAKDDIDEHGEFSSTVSHEVLEMLADPDVNQGKEEEGAASNAKKDYRPRTWGLKSKTA